MTDENFNLISSVDNVFFSVNKSYLYISKVITASLEDEPTASSIELNLSQHVLEPIVMYMNLCQGIDVNITPDTMKDNKIEDVITNQNILSLIDTLGQNIKLLYQVIDSCNYLDIPGLLNLCLFKVASLIKEEPVRNISGILSGSNMGLKDTDYTTYSFEIEDKNVHIDILKDFKRSYIDQFLKDIFLYLAYPKFKIYIQNGNDIDELTDPGYLKYVLTKLISIYGDTVINWNKLSENSVLTPEIIREFRDKWNWGTLSLNPVLIPEIIQEFKEKWTWYFLSQSLSLTSEIILDFKDKWDWNGLSWNPDLTPEIIREFKDKWNWERLSLKYILTSQIIREFKDKWDWDTLSINFTLTQEIIREFKEKWNWDTLSENSALNPQIIREFKEKWNWDTLSESLLLTPEIIREFKEKWNWEELSVNPSLTPEIIREFKDKWNWEELSWHHSLTPLIIREFKDKWNWEGLSWNPSLTLEIIREFKEKWNWDTLSKNRSLNLQIIHEFKDEWNWDTLSKNRSLNLQIIREFKDKWNWEELSTNRSLTPKIIRVFKDKWNQKSPFYQYLQYSDLNIEGIDNDFIFYLISSRGDIYKYLNNKIKTLYDKYRKDVYIHYLDQYLIPQLTIIVLNYM
jgi:hypothetical protein